MGAESGRSTTALIELLSAQPHRFEFFQAVRLLERHARERSPNGAEERGETDEIVEASENGEPEGEARNQYVGTDGNPTKEAVRFRVAPSLAFPASEIADLRPGDGDGEAHAGAEPWQMAVNFLGLIGPSGVLPPHYTELVQRRLQLRDPSLREFLDAFHHRTLSLFYRSWRKYRLPIEYEYEGMGGRFTASLSSLVGLGLKTLQGRQSYADASAVYYAGHFAQTHRSAAALESLLHDFFGLPIRVEQFVGRWLTIPESERSRMPGRDAVRTDAGRLGGGLAIGNRVWDVQSKLRIHAGPISYEEFADLLAPKRPGQRRMRDIVRTFVGIEFDFDLLVHLKPGSAPPLALGGRGPGGARLGENSWMAAFPTSAVAAPALFELA